MKEDLKNIDGSKALPEDIANMLGKSPHEYFQAGLELTNWKKRDTN